RGISVPRLFSNDVAAATMSPTSVVPPRTGGAAFDVPDNVVPLLFSVAVTISAGDSVPTPEIEKVPSAPVVLVFPWTPTVTPAIGCSSAVTTRPITVVNGSGITLTCTSLDTPTLDPRSTAFAESVRLPAPTGA